MEASSSSSARKCRRNYRPIWGELTEEQLRFIMSQTKFSPRLLLWRRQMYRAQRLRDFLEDVEQRRIGPKLPASQIPQVVQTVTLIPFLVGRGNTL